MIRKFDPRVTFTRLTIFPVLIALVGSLIAEPAYAGVQCPTIGPGTSHSAWERDERPRLLVNALPDGALRERLARCLDDPPGRAQRTIGHRGAPLRYPEHTRESYLAAARLGASTLECDVAVTADGVLVCRHAQCDLHRTTNILATPLADRCRQDRVNAAARSVQEWYAPERETEVCVDSGTLLSHRQSIELFAALGVAMAPELKPHERTGTEGVAEQAMLADQLLAEYREAGVPPERVWLQSFEPEVVGHWLATAGDFAARVVWLDGRYQLPGFDHRDRQQNAHLLASMRARGLKNVGPPLWMLLEYGHAGPEPSAYAQQLRAAEMTVLTWTVERSGPLAGGGGWYYQTLNGENPATDDDRPGWVSRDGDQLAVLDVLFDEVGVAAVFSDWPSRTALVDRCLAKP